MTDEARRGMLYAQRVLGELPSNHPQVEAATHGASQLCVDSARERYQRLRDSDLIMNIRRTAGLAKAARCGNCGEYATVAFDHLMLTGCPYSLEFASYVFPPGDHAFVVVGRSMNTDPSEPLSWGPDAVICDAWAGRVVPARAYWNLMPSSRQGVQRPEISVRWPLPPADYPRERATSMTV